MPLFFNFLCSSSKYVVSGLAISSSRVAIFNGGYGVFFFFRSRGRVVAVVCDRGFQQPKGSSSFFCSGGRHCSRTEYKAPARELSDLQGLRFRMSLKLVIFGFWGCRVGKGDECHPRPSICLDSSCDIGFGEGAEEGDKCHPFRAYSGC